MEKPEGCPNRLYQLMNTCWQYSPRQRPTFLDIIDELLQDIPLTAAAFAQVDRRILIEMLPPSFIENWTLTTRLPFVLLLVFFLFSPRQVSFFHSDAGCGARQAHRDQETRLHHDPTTPLTVDQDTPLDRQVSLNWLPQFSFGKLTERRSRRLAAVAGLRAERAPPGRRRRRRLQRQLGVGIGLPPTPAAAQSTALPAPGAFLLENNNDSRRNRGNKKKPSYGRAGVDDGRGGGAAAAAAAAAAAVDAAARRRRR